MCIYIGVHSTLSYSGAGNAQQGVLRGPGPPNILEKCAQFSEKGDFVIFITLLGPPQYLLCCARPDIVNVNKDLTNIKALR